MKLIPAIDIIDGKAVRLTGGDFTKKKIYSDHPLLTAQAFEAVGFQHLHLVDLDGAKSGKVQNLAILQSISQQTNLEVDFGGGVKTERDLKAVLEAGAKKVTIGTLAVKNPSLVKNWIQQYGPDKIILGADVKEEFIAVQGWLEKSKINLFDFLEDYSREGITQIICTDISKDGFLEGSAIDLYQSIISSFPNLEVIASGGVSSMAEIEVLKNIGCSAAIIGKALYEGILLPSALSEWAQTQKQC